MISDCEKRSSLRSAVSSFFESATSIFENNGASSIIHPLELEPSVEIEIDSPGSPDRRSIFSGHVPRHSTDLRKSLQQKR